MQPSPLLHTLARSAAVRCASIAISISLSSSERSSTTEVAAARGDEVGARLIPAAQRIAAGEPSTRRQRLATTQHAR